METRPRRGISNATRILLALAAGLAQGLALREAVLRARRYVRAAIASAPGLGAGHGPLNHAVTVDLAALQS